MSLAVWLKKGKVVNVGGRDLYLMPLPLTKMYSVGNWLEKNATEVIKETIESVEPGNVPNPMALIARLLLRIDVSSLAMVIFSAPKNPDTGEPLNPNLTKEFFDDYLDSVTAREAFETFLQINDIEKLIKNLQSLPVVKKLQEATSLTFGTQFLNILQQNTVSTQSKSEGSQSPKSTDTSKQPIEEKSDLSNRPTVM